MVWWFMMHLLACEHVVLADRKQVSKVLKSKYPQILCGRSQLMLKLKDEEEEESVYYFLYQGKYKKEGWQMWWCGYNIVLQ